MNTNKEKQDWANLMLKMDLERARYSAMYETPTEKRISSRRKKIKFFRNIILMRELGLPR
jgi:hypothetical protein